MFLPRFGKICWDSQISLFLFLNDLVFGFKYDQSSGCKRYRSRGRVFTKDTSISKLVYRYQTGDAIYLKTYLLLYNLDYLGRSKLYDFIVIG